jgi:hypothetical protein
MARCGLLSQAAGSAHLRAHPARSRNRRRPDRLRVPGNAPASVTTGDDAATGLP